MLYISGGHIERNQTFRDIKPNHDRGRGLVKIVKTNLAGTEYEVTNTTTPVFVITHTTLISIEKLVENLKKLGIKDLDGELVYDEEGAGYEYLQ